MPRAGVPAFVVHEVPGRLRLKIPSRRGNEGFFAEVSECLARCPGIEGVEGKPRTGSLVVRYSPATGSAGIAAQAKQAGLFTVAGAEDQPHRTLLQRAAVGAEALDHGLAAVSRGYLDLRSGIFIMLLLMAVRQAAQGQIMVPAFSLLVFAAELIGRGGARPA